MAERRLRVTHVIHELHPGGAEQVLLDLAAALPAVGVDLSVLSLMPARGQVYATRLGERGVPVTSLGLPSRWDARGLARAVGALAATRPDVVHTHMKHADLVGAVAARRLRVPLVSTLHLIEDAVTPLGRGKRWLAGQARLVAADRTIAVSDAVRRWYLTTFRRAKPETVVTIRNGRAAPEELTSAGRQHVRAGLGLPPDALVVANVGLMRPGKGQAAVLEATARLRQDPAIPDEVRQAMRVLLVGDGELRPELERRVDALNLRGTVVFAGYREDVLTLLQACDVLVSASDFDALPTAVIEALAAGLPVVAYRVGGVPEIATADVGELVEVGDVDGLAAALGRLLTDPQQRERYGRAARTRFAAEFAADAFAARLRALYDELAPTPTPSAEAPTAGTPQTGTGAAGS